MRRLLPACDEFATASVANNAVSMQQADAGFIQLVKNCIDKLTTTLNKRAQKVGNGHVLGPIGQLGLPPTQLFVPAVLLVLGVLVQWGSATADMSPAPLPPNSLPAINQPQAQGHVVLGVVPFNINRRLTNRKGKGKGKSLQVSFRRNLNCRLTDRKGQGKDMRKDKSIRVSFRRNLNLQLTNCKGELFLVSFRRKDKWLKLLS